jgi:type VI secretion system protein ImpC
VSASEKAAAASQPAAAGQPAADKTEKSILDQAISLTPKTERSYAQDMLQNLAEWALNGTVSWDKNVTRSITEGMDKIDQMISKQLSAIMHAPAFQKLEGSWRGLSYLVFNSNTNTMLKLKVLNLPKKELLKDVESAVEFDQSQIFKKVYSSEFDQAGGEPYGAMIGDYEITNHPDDMTLLTKMSEVAAAGFCPFIAAGSPELFGFDSWTELAKPRDLAKIFDTVEHVKWQSFRKSEDSRFVTLALPRVLARLPYGAQTRPIEEFKFEEFEENRYSKPQPAAHDHFTWMNAAYIMGARLTDAFDQHGFCVAIRGAEGGGAVRGLPSYIFTSDDGDPDLKCPTEIAITDRREKELSDLGFLPLCHYKNTDYAVFFGAQTTQKPKKYQGPDGADATANAAISARLPYIMATSRFAHYLKVMARDWIGAFMEVNECEEKLNAWILNYVDGSAKPSQETKAKRPLRDAKVVVKDDPSKPGVYNAICFLRPWLQLEELNASLRMVARIPQLGG